MRDAVTIGVWTRATAPAVASWLAARVDRSLDDSTLLVAELATELDDLDELRRLAGQGNTTAAEVLSELIDE